MRLIKAFFFLAFLFYGSLAFANPMPLGLEVGVAKCESIKTKYRIIKTIDTDYGIEHHIDIKDISITGINSVQIGCDKNQIIQGILISAKKDRFDFFYKPLTEKYKLISQSIPFVGTKSAEFHDGNVAIWLKANHLSFDMQITYITDSLAKLLQDNIKNEEKEKRKTTKELL